jgi:N-methylhydantoinase A
MSFRLGVDIGGTFTDFALLEDASGEVWTHKQLTTPHDPAEAVLEGVAALLAQTDVSIGDVAWFAHGTTLVTNALIERKGARTGMLVTAGFRDVLDMAYETRYDLFDLRLKFPAPLVPRSLRREVDERLRFDGTMLRPLDEKAVLDAVRDLRDEHEIESLAVCFLHSFIKPDHEERVRALCADAFPDLFVSTSADVVPTIREYERWTTTAINAYTQPLFSRYLARLLAGLEGLGFRGSPVIMTSAGGMLAPSAAQRYPVRALESGPAAGVLMTAHHGARLGESAMISYDMGGTTAKGALVRDHRPLKADRMEVARVHEFKRGSGLPVKIPTIDMVEIGAGGGSIAAVDARGLISVGPRSAGADPGPACYGAGGEQPTLTDANLVLGFLDPAFFLGGAMALDLDAARRAIADKVATPLGISVEEAAWGIHETINEDVSRAFRIHAAERGFDYRRAAVVAFGGSGPAHAFRVARKLRAPRVVFPIGAGVMSAFGLLVSPVSFSLSRSDPVTLEALDAAGFAQRFEALIARTTEPVQDSETPDLAITCRLDMRYEGQGHEIEVELPEGAAPDTAFARLPDLFRAAYARVFSTSQLDQPLEIVNWKVEASVRRPAIDALRLARTGESGETAAARKGERDAYFADVGYVACPVYDRYRLAPGDRIEGPALVEERESTVVIDAACHAVVDDDRNLIGVIGEGI